MECYFSSENLWEPGETCHQTLTVVGLLKEKTEQVYFAPKLCQMLTIGLDKISLTGEFCYDIRYQRYLGSFSSCTVMVSDDLKDNQIRISENYELPSTGYGLLPSTKEEAFSGQGLLHIIRKTDDADAANNTSGDESDDSQTDGSEQTFDITFAKDFSTQGADFIEVSESLYKKLCEFYDLGTTQSSVYIANYGKTDKVLSSLQKLGYDAVSTYQVSSTKYIEEKVYQRLEVLAISCLVLLGLALLQVLVLRSVLMIKKQDYAVLKFMGMKRKQMQGIAYEEMGFLCVLSVAAALVLVYVLWICRLPFLRNMMSYYSVPGLFLYVIYNLFLMVMTVFFFHRKMQRSLANEM
jgi:ABC-type antimicrobial peptide transport system permease subunit